MAKRYDYVEMQKAVGTDARVPIASGAPRTPNVPLGRQAAAFLDYEAPVSMDVRPAVQCGVPCLHPPSSMLPETYERPNCLLIGSGSVRADGNGTLKSSCRLMKTRGNFCQLAFPAGATCKHKLTLATSYGHLVWPPLTATSYRWLPTPQLNHLQPLGIYPSVSLQVYSIVALVPRRCTTKSLLHPATQPGPVYSCSINHNLVSPETTRTRREIAQIKQKHCPHKMEDISRHVQSSPHHPQSSDE